MKIDHNNRFWRGATIASIILNVGFLASVLYRGCINSSRYARYRHYAHSLTHSEPPQRYLGYQTFEEFKKSFYGNQGVITPVERIEAAVLCLNTGHEDMDIYGEQDFWASPEVIWEKAEDDCDGGAMVGGPFASLTGIRIQFSWAEKAANQTRSGLF
ncbi:MAG: hypothetical protein HY512_01895 [Candidatus Aenigmarchaeota archaeon]|nr:hypothetical protein [Candidatus Aenigmarchaeota archaeon]